LIVVGGHLSFVSARLLGVDDPAWDEFRSGVPHDMYHLPRYAALCAGQDHGEAVALLSRAGGTEVLVPLVVRPLDGGGYDAASPYGYPGPLARGEDVSPAAVGRALANATGLLHDRGIVAVFLRLHPLLDREPPMGFGTVVRHGETVAVDLAKSEERLWAETRKDHRQQIGRAIRAGHQVVIDPDPRPIRIFQEQYLATMERRGADAYYLFDDRYFQELEEALGDRLHIATVDIEGEIAASALFAETDGIVEMHLSAHDRRFDRHAPKKLLYHGVRGWARARGDRWLHLGGGRGATADSLLEFKAGFSPVRQPFHTLRAVIDHDRYAEVVHASHPDMDPEDLSGFFPPYREADRGEASESAPALVGA
jgi:hypothetical protein